MKKAMPLIAAACVSVLLGSLLVFHYVANYHRDVLRFSPGNGLVENDAFLLDLNLADADELSSLPGIGDTLSGRIIAYREEIGQFTDTAQLLQIKGITDRIYRTILPLITIGG